MFPSGMFCQVASPCSFMAAFGARQAVAHVLFPIMSEHSARSGEALLARFTNNDLFVICHFYDCAAFADTAGIIVPVRTRIVTPQGARGRCARSDFDPLSELCC